MSVGLASLASTVLWSVDPASAHPGDPHETDAQHAAEDRAGTPMSQIERETRANAAKIKQSTGATPGRRNKKQVIANDRLSIAAAADPGQGGQWSGVVNTPVVPIFQAMLPNGKVLLWDSVGEMAAEDYPDPQTFTRAAVWDPSNDTYHQVNVTGYNIFCAGYVQLADGRVLVAGGNKDQALHGIVQTHLFDWRTETWSRGPDMASGRWYPSVAPLNNGEAMILGGGPTTAEVYQRNNKLRQLTGFTTTSSRRYPFLVPRPNGQVEQVGPTDDMHTFTTTGVGALTATRSRDGINRDYGSFATYDIGKVLVAGGGNLTEDGQTSVPTRTARVVDVNGSGTSVRSTASMSVGRRQFNLTVLADGSVLATGGQSKSTDSLVDLTYPVFAAERWDPATETWSVLSSASRVREYHSSVTLLPDGRLLTGGGGVCGVCTTKGYLEKNLEYFTPPYLYKQDGSGTLADRPVIDSAPKETGYGQSFSVSSAQAGSIAKVGLVRLGAATHGDDQGQRYVPLPFSASGSTLQVNSPANASVAPPGYYMLFVTDKAGVPSKAAMVKVTPPRRVKNDYNGDGKSDIATWRPSTGTWSVRGGSTTTWGASTDQPVQADYNGDGRTDVAVWRPSTGEWRIYGRTGVVWGQSGDVPVPGDYNGDGQSELAVWRPSTGQWVLRDAPDATYGVKGDIPVADDYDGDGRTDIAVWRPSTGKYYVRGQITATWGVSGDKPVPGDYDGDGKADIAVWRPSTGKWYVYGQVSTVWGANGDKPVPGDYDGNGTTDLTYWRPSSATWAVRGGVSVAFGQSGDVPV